MAILLNLVKSRYDCGFLNDTFHTVYLDNMIFHRLQRRLTDRNYGCRQRPRYLIFSQFSICCCQNAFASGALLRISPGVSSQHPQLANVARSHHCRGPHRIAGPRAPRPHDPPLRFIIFFLITISYNSGTTGFSSHVR